MEEEILKLIYDYSIKWKLADYNYIDKLVNIIVNYKKLSEYVRKVIIADRCEDKKDSMAEYKNKTLTLYKLQISEFFKNNKNSQKNFSILENLFFNNVLITYIILHELSHAKQFKISDSDIDSLESFIIKLCVKNSDVNMFSKKLKQIVKRINYIKNYDIAPVERMAEIDSYQEMLNILDPIKCTIPYLINYLYEKRDANLFYGYDFTDRTISSPSFRYFKNSNELESFNHFDWYNEDENLCLKNLAAIYSLDERLRFGLPAKNVEYSHYLIDRSKRW